MTTSKKKNISKKKKIAWRKYIDTKDVDNFLEDQRLEERLGKPFVERTNEELFFIDTNKNKDKKVSKQKPITYEPKCFNQLKSHSQVKDPISKRNSVKTATERAHPLAVKKKNIKLLKSLQRKKKGQNNLKKKSDLNKEIVISNDIWTEEVIDPLEKDEWLEKDTVRHTRTGTGKLVKSVPSSVRTKKSVLPSIEVPHPGISYNPSLDDHLDLLNTIADNEEKLIKEEKHLSRVTSKMFSKTTTQEKNQNDLFEMSEGLSFLNKKDEDSANEEELTDNEFKSVNPPVLNKKKDRKQRRKQEEQKKLKLEQKLTKVEKKKISDIYKLRFINKNFEKNEQKLEKLKEKRLKLKKYKELEPKRLASTKYEQSDLEYNAGQDIAGNLRNIKTEGSLLFDRYKNLQKRNILEPAKIRMKKKTKVKRFVKSDHK